MIPIKKDKKIGVSVPSNFVDEIKVLVKRGHIQAYAAVNECMIATYWEIGKRIVEEEQHGSDRAQYSKKLIKTLSEFLTMEFGEGFSPRYLRAFRQFYLLMPSYEIWKSRFPNLTWTHIFRTQHRPSKRRKRSTTDQLPTKYPLSSPQVRPKFAPSSL